MKKFDLLERAVALALGLFFIVSYHTYADADIFNLSYSGRLVQNNGEPMSGLVNLTISFYASENSTSPVLTKNYSSISLGVNGDYALEINLLPAERSLLNNEIWVELTVGNTPINRAKYSAVPYALKVPMDGIVAADSCTDGNILVYDANDKQFKCVVPSSGGGGGPSSTVTTGNIVASGEISASNAVLTAPAGTPSIVVNSNNADAGTAKTTVWKNGSSDVAYVTKDGEVHATKFIGTFQGNATTATSATTADSATVADVANSANALNSDNDFVVKNMTATETVNHAGGSLSSPGIHGPNSGGLFAWTTTPEVQIGGAGTTVGIGGPASSGYTLNVSGDIKTDNIQIINGSIAISRDVPGASPAPDTTKMTTLNADGLKTIDTAVSPSAAVLTQIMGGATMSSTEVTGTAPNTTSTVNTSTLKADSNGALVVSKIVTAQGNSPVTTTTTLSAGKIVTKDGSGTIVPTKIDGGIDVGSQPISGDGSNLTNLSGSNITDGTITDDKIATGLSGSKVSGALSNATIASTAITGTIDDSQVATGLTASKVSGALSNATIASTAITGTIDDSQVATGLTASKVSGALSNATIASSSITGSITDSQVASGISASKISGALSNATISSFTGSLVGDVTGTQGATVVSSVGGSSASAVNTAVTAVTNATNSNTNSTIVKRDSSGNFSAGTITATLAGNATSATSSTNFSGSLVGDVTGTQGATVVSSVGGSSASAVNTAVTAVTNATNSNTNSTIVKRDSSGNFSAGTITAALAGNATSATSSTNFSGSLVGDVTGTQTATVVSSVGGSSASAVNTGVTAANSATDSNTNSTIVKRDSSGGFSAGTIAANAINLSAQPFIQVDSTGAQTLAHTVGATLTTFTNVIKTRGTGLSVSGGGIVAATAGVYIASVTITFAQNGAGNRAAWFEINESGERYGYVDGMYNNYFVGYTLTSIMVLSAGQKVTVTAYQASGGNLDITGTKFILTKLH